MLDEYKQLYKEKADLLKNWKKLGRSELAFRYLKYKDKDDILAEAYLSALIYKFWNVIEHNYYKQTIKYASPEDCYQWVIDAILYVLDKHVWTDPNSNLYEDKNAPEKAINVFIVHARDRFYIANNTDKRKLNQESISIQQLDEDYPGWKEPSKFDKDDLIYDVINTKVNKLFNEKRDVAAFTIDTIVTIGNVFETITENNIDYSIFSVAKLKRYLRNIPKEYGSIFANKYNLNEQKVEDSIQYLHNMSYEDMNNAITYFFNEIKLDKSFIKALRGVN